eukprot:637583-Amphidinium_carterae.1
MEIYQEAHTALALPSERQKLLATPSKGHFHCMTSRPHAQNRSVGVSLFASESCGCCCQLATLGLKRLLRVHLARLERKVHNLYAPRPGVDIAL